jgi:beta-lactamase class A
MMNKENDSASRGLLSSRFALVLAILIGFAAGFILRGHFRPGSGHEILEIRQGGWHYINPLLECEQAQTARENGKLENFADKVNDFVIKKQKDLGDTVSVYFRELNDGYHFDIGKDDFFYPASLLKVPTMISILKQAESNPRLLKTTVAFNDSKLLKRQNLDAKETLALGKSYTVDDLVYRMVKYSDNISYYLLMAKVIDRPVLEQTFRDLGFPSPYVDISDAQTRYVLSAEQYSSCFRVLYNATYLNKPMSEKALEYLSKSDFEFGLVAYLPATTVVAHKFGLSVNNEGRQLHDCGIVYYPNHPYLLCVMTASPVKRGDSFDSAIGEISRFIYQEVDRQHGIL